MLNPREVYRKVKSGDCGCKERREKYIDPIAAAIKQRFQPKRKPR